MTPERQFAVWVVYFDIALEWFINICIVLGIILIGTLIGYIIWRCITYVRDHHDKQRTHR